MNSTRRMFACALVALVLDGPLGPGAMAQPPAPPPIEPSQPAVIIEMAPPERPVVRGTDIYDVGAGVVTAARVPFNVVLCGFGGAVGTAIFLMTLGSAYRATTRVIEEGCAQRWIIRGDDLRPRGAPGILPDRSSETYRR